MKPKVQSGLFKPLWIIIELAQRHVTFPAQELTYFPGCMTVVNGKASTIGQIRFPTQAATMILKIQEGVVDFLTNAILPLAAAHCLPF